MQWSKGSDGGVDHQAVPYFFSDLSDWAAIEYVGPAYDWDREIIRGSLDNGAFSVFYLQSGIVQGAFEGSNVQPVLEITRMMDNERQFQFVTQLIQAEGDRQQSTIDKLLPTGQGG